MDIDMVEKTLNLSVPPEIFKEFSGILPDILFYRNDGRHVSVRAKDNNVFEFTFHYSGEVTDAELRAEGDV